MPKSFPLPARISRSILLAMTPLFALSACKTVDVTLNARPCFTEMVSATGLKADTPHAPIPGPTVGEIEAYGNAEGGQLDKSNARARAIVGIGETCDRWAEEAEKLAEKKPWWRRVF